MGEKLEIRKGGKLIETKWVYDKAAKQGEYKEFDRTDSALRHIWDNCQLSADVTLRDIFLLLNTELDVFDALIGNWCKEIVTEGLTKPAKAVGVYDPDEIEFLELRQNFYYDESSQYGPSFYGYNRPDFGGVGYELKEDKLFDWIDKATGKPAIEWPKGERIPWGISFSKANDLIDLPVKLDTEARVFNENVDDKVNYHNQITTYKGATYSLGSILYGIIWEMSFHGGPDKRDEVGDGLRQTVADIKSGKEETIAIDDLDEWLGEYAEEAKKRESTDGNSNPT